MKGVMYHYIRPTDSAYPNLNYLNVEDFEKQLDYFQENYGFVSKTQWHDAIESGFSDSDGVVLTFDDGLADHYKYVYPILKRRGLWGIFYVSSGPFHTSKLLDVHMVHLLLGKFNSEDVLLELNDIIDDSMLIAEAKDRFNDVVYNKQDSGLFDKEVKKIINYYLRPDCKADVLKSLFDAFFYKENEVFSGFYLSLLQIKEMHASGFCFGGHGKTHSLLSNLDKSTANNEIADSISLLRTTLGIDAVISFCYPYGGVHSYTKSVLETLESHQVPYSFSVEGRDIENVDLCSKFELPRYDCNAFPYGKVRK
jgi:peptidoglycan/xylan/chitin deacetylase (PgdA/CDA1 family)